jgi:hypothetical protein
MKKLLSLIILVTFVISLMASVSPQFSTKISKITGNKKFASTHISLPQRIKVFEKIAVKENYMKKLVTNLSSNVYEK